jgi:hypothetical protein
MFIINSCVDKCCNNYLEEYFKSNQVKTITYLTLQMIKFQLNKF